MPPDPLPAGMTSFDWIVIGLYAVAVIGIGKYFARRVVTMDDYLLGGRTMRPWAVGLSLFATLVSSISFLATPGEMIKHGPMIISEVLSFPLIVLVVGWLIIPRIMKLRVTSAYELLEIRFGPRVRILGALMFLTLRLLWMAVIIYATSSKVLLPLLGWSPAMVPLLSVALGVVTVIYTSEGGMRAVVFTDVLQSMLLIGGAIAAIVVISSDLGGVAAWWPSHWATEWEEPKIWFDPEARVTVASAFLAAFSWYVCTAGSDQLSIQRYLATRDVAAARRMYAISLAANAVVLGLLACLGMALFAWYQAHPHMLAAGETIDSSADRLLPRFMVYQLPPGASGLIVAALLAAAMSSLSSGINSSCTVITVDFVDRFRPSGQGETDHVRLARYISWAVGIVVVVLSLWAGSVPGNLLEVTGKISNLLVGPLAILFIMAIFVPWSTELGTVLGSLIGLAVAVSISLYEAFGLSFVWIVPSSALIGSLVAMAVSALARRKP